VEEQTAMRDRTFFLLIIAITLVLCAFILWVMMRVPII
jgi:hypothetical protein